MTKKIPKAHKELILESLNIKKSIDEKINLDKALINKVKDNAINTVKDYKSIKYQLGMVKDIASLFISNE